MGKRVLSVLLAAIIVFGFFICVPTVPAHAATANQRNIVARADYMYNSTWVCQKTTTCCAYGSYYTFYAGSTYRIPYGQNTYTGAYIGYGVSVDTFLSAAANPNSVYYNSRGTNSYNGYYSLYYATDCSGFVSYCWDATYKQSTRSLASISTRIGGISTYNFTWNLQLGDALNRYDYHVVLVTGLTYDSSGAITQIEITESTIPTLKRSYYTPAQLASKYSSYDGIYRYYGSVDAPPSSDHWERDSTGWWYEYADGSYAIGWTFIDGSWYYFSKSGYMYTGWLFDEGYQAWFFLDTTSGKMRTGWVYSNGYHYYMDSSGQMYTGWQKIDNDWYYFNTTDQWPLGAMFTGWHEINGKMYYFSEASDGTLGEMVTGWFNDGYNWYYFDSAGAMMYGWQRIDEKWYYLDDTTGIMASRAWAYDEGVWYYVDASGAMVDGARWANGGTYDAALDLGTEFYATIDIPLTGTRAGVDSDTSSDTYKNLEVQAVRTKDADHYDEQLWYFVRRDDGSYRITNVATGMCLDVAGGYIEAGTNVRVWDGNDALAQRWFIFQNGENYGLVAACNVWDKTVLDVADGLADEGTNIRIWANNGYGAQQFMINRIDEGHSAHNYEATIIAPTCTKDGYTIHTCSVCGDSYSDTTVQATGVHTYVNGVCTGCGETAPVKLPVLNPTSATLSLDGEVVYKVYFTADDITSIQSMGMLTFDTEPVDGTIENADEVISNVELVNGTYIASSNGIPAKKLGDDVYIRLYAKLYDGTYVYSRVIKYSGKIYADYMLDYRSDDPALQKVVVAMLNYGAEAQTFFGYKTDSLMNADLTESEKNMIVAYNSTLVPSRALPDAGKTGNFPKSDKFSYRSASMVLEGALAINYRFVPSLTPDSGLTLYYWTEDTYNSVDALSLDNIDGQMTMEQDASGYYTATYDGLAAKQMGDVIYIAAVYESNGETHTTGVIAYSLYTYCNDAVTYKQPSAEIAKAAAIYGYYAENYFGY